MKSKSVSVVVDTGEVIEPLFRKQLSRVSVKVPVDPDAVSATHQSHRDSCDVNAIVKQYARSGTLPPPLRPPQFGDVSNLNRDLTSLVLEARESAKLYNDAIAARKAAADKQAAADKAAFKEWKESQAAKPADSAPTPVPTTSSS